MCAVTVPLYSLCCDKPTHPPTHPEWTVNNLFLALALEFVAKHVVDHVLSSTVHSTVQCRYSSIYDSRPYLMTVCLNSHRWSFIVCLSVRPSVY